MKAKSRLYVKAIVPVVLVFLALVVPATASAADGWWYTVRGGDTLYSIAARYGTTVSAIVQANGLRNPNYIWVGQRLFIPAGGGYTPPRHCNSWHTVQRGETLFQIGRLYSVSPWCIAQANHLANPNYIWAGQHLYIPCSCGYAPPAWCSYTVVRGDTLYRLAVRFGTCVQTLVQMNHLRDPSRIYVGQRLLVPCR